MVAGETGDHGPPIAPPTVCKTEIGQGRGRGKERALVLFHREMELTVLEMTPTNIFVVETALSFSKLQNCVDIVQYQKLIRL